MSVISNKEKTKRIALGGILSAVSLVIMTIGSFITVLDMTAAYAAGFAVIIAMIECDKFTSIGVYFVSGVIAFLILPDKFTGVAFLCYGGLYPILKSFCEKIKNKYISWLSKFAVSNILLTLMIWLGLYFTYKGDEPLGFEIWVYALGNAVFVVYDIALTMIISKYIKSYKGKFIK